LRSTKSYLGKTSIERLSLEDAQCEIIESQRNLMVTAMATNKSILFVTLPEQGHLLPTIQVARGLSEFGYQILYLTALHFSSILAQFGFETFGLMEHPDGEEEHISSSGWTYWYCFDERSGASRAFALWKQLVQILDSRNVVGIVADNMIAEDFGLPLKLLTERVRCYLIATMLPNWDRPGLRFPHPRAYLCPESFELPELRVKDPFEHYCEPSIYAASHAIVLPPKNRGRGRRRRVLVAFGTQSTLHPDLTSRFEMIGAIARARSDLEFDLVMGESPTRESSLLRLPALPNLTLHKRVNQLEMLHSADLFITHGGLGSIKEAVFVGVPMIVLPEFFDQPFNAIRIERHMLGISLLSGELNTAALLRAIEEVLQSDAILSRVEEFSVLFRKAENNPTTARRICDYFSV
jgi:UDP:flavonoid glycosyltransferase YjiC (YdhE family)